MGSTASSVAPSKYATIFASSPQDPYTVDIEQKAVDDAHLLNDTVRNFAWSGITVTVKDHKTKRPKDVLRDVSGFVEAGELCALMGPSGSGKTTLLDILARRNLASGAKTLGTSVVNGKHPSLDHFRQLSSYVEQEDALIGSLTVRETMHFAARLAHKNALSKMDRIARIEALISSFGLTQQANTIIGTPLRKGISGGQKRRVSVASQLLTGPKLLFLDEPTSGLDSAASKEVISFIREVAKRNNLIVIASIHQPSASTFQLFDKLLLLSSGKSHYFGPVRDVSSYLQSIGNPVPPQTNPAEFILELMNTDFARNQKQAQENLQQVLKQWTVSNHYRLLESQLDTNQTTFQTLKVSKAASRNIPVVIMTLIHRSFIKSYRDVIAYSVRVVMYTCLAIMMGTVWLRLKDTQESIQPWINQIFFGSAFMSFMAVAYIPSFLEDRATFIKDRANGLYGPAAFTFSNFIIGLPYLFLISVIFSSICYWLSNLHATPTAFFTWVMWLFLDLVAAESLVVLISSIFPVFVISLALTAFANGLWMTIGGFMITPKLLNVFWKYVFSYIDYQAYVFKGMMVNEFAERTYDCGSACECMYQTPLASECRIAGQGVLDLYGYETGKTGEWVGILLAIVLGYRLLGWAVMVLKK